MTTNAGMQLEPGCCNPCNKCDNDGEILPVDILPSNDCGGGCGCGGCKDNCGINIQSTNECLKVDTSECGIVKLTAKCPKPTYVTAGENVVVKETFPPDDCYIDGGDCDIKGGWEVSATDEKVKTCSSDTTSGYLNEKLIAGPGIYIDEIGCDGDTNSKLKISFDETVLPDCPDIPDITIDNRSNLIKATPVGHHITITDKENTFYDNNVCIGFIRNIDSSRPINADGNMTEAVFIESRDRFTGNGELATSKGIKIKTAGYYRVFGQITVQCNIGDNKYLNLGRGLLRVNGAREILQLLSLSTAKHGGYTISPLLYGGDGIKIDNKGVISVTGTRSKYIGEGGGNVQFNPGDFNSGVSQAMAQLDGPWMTYNMDCYIDLEAGDVITLGWRGQGDMINDGGSPAHSIGYFRFVGVMDSSTEYNALFGGSCLGVQMVAPKLFQRSENNKVFGTIYQ